MAMLEVSHLKKVYTTRFGGNQVEALRNVSFTVEQGEYTAIMGESGSGKTTLLNILASLDTPTAGKVLVDGKDFTTLKDNERAIFRRSNLGFIFQDFNLIPSLNVWENIVLPLGLDNRKVKPREVEDILKKIGLQDKKDAMPSALSGGQKQRLCIARALLKKPKILILDDSTSAVDTKTDALIRKAFREEIPNTTKIIIAQRVSSIEDADQIIVLDDGKIMGVGTSEELLKTNDIYREVYESQVKGGEDDE